jgi:hypothetical protein
MVSGNGGCIPPLSADDQEEVNMKPKGLFVPFSLTLLLIFLSACELGIVEPAIPDRGVYVTPPVPSGGTYDDPNFIVTPTCSQFGIFVFDIRYSPADLEITDWGVETAVRDFGGGFLDDGWLQDTLELDPFATPVEYMVCYGDRDRLDNPCTYFPVDLPACPPFVPSFELRNIECWDDTIGVSVNVSTGLVVSASACQSVGDCSDPSAIQYSTDWILGNYARILFSGPRPPVDMPLHVCIRVPGQAAGTPDFCGDLDDYYTRYLGGCPALVPTSTAAPGVAPQPPACSEYDNGLDCGNAGCSWWANMTCHEETDPCHQYDGDDKTCGEVGCVYDPKDSSCNTP